jgi:hypothetical protein
MTTRADSRSEQDPMLLPERDAPYVLKDVYEKGDPENPRTEIVLQWNDGCLMFRVDEDTDSLSAEFLDAPSLVSHRRISSEPPWDQYIGKECGWTWVAINQQGYCDSALLSFQGIVPSVMLHVIASAIQFFVISKP